MSVIPIWSIPDHELIREGLLRENEIARRLAERLDVAKQGVQDVFDWQGFKPDFPHYEIPPLAEIDHIEGFLDEIDVDPAARAAVADLYNAGGFLRKELVDDAPPALWDAEDDDLLDHLEAGRKVISGTLLDLGTLEGKVRSLFSCITGANPSEGTVAHDVLDQLRTFLEKRTTDFVAQLGRVELDNAAFERLVASLTDTIATKDRHIAELQKTPEPIEEKEPAMSLETRMESLENRMVSLEDAIERLIAVMSAGPVPTAAAARTRKTANTNKKEETPPVVEPVTETATVVPTSAQPEPSRPASTEISQSEVIDALSRLPREQAFAIVSAHSPTKKLSGIPTEKYAAVLAECAAAAGQEAA